MKALFRYCTTKFVKTTTHKGRYLHEKYRHFQPENKNRVFSKNLNSQILIQAVLCLVYPTQALQSGIWSEEIFSSCF